MDLGSEEAAMECSDLESLAPVVDNGIWWWELTSGFAELNLDESRESDDGEARTRRLVLVI